MLLNFLFQKCRDPNPRLDLVGGSKSKPRLLRHFQLSYQNIWLVLFILDFVITRKHFILGKPINIYNFKGLIIFTLNKMHLQNKSSEFKLFYKMSMFERNGVMHMTEHTPQLPLYDSELLNLGSCFNVYHSVPAH